MLSPHTDVSVGSCAWRTLGGDQEAHGHRSPELPLASLISEVLPAVHPVRASSWMSGVDLNAHLSTLCWSPVCPCIQTLLIELLLQSPVWEEKPKPARSVFDV